MIPFENKEHLSEWLVNLDNHVTLLKANLVCEQRQCTVVEKSTDGFIYKKRALESTEAIRNCASMISQLIGKCSD